MWKWVLAAVLIPVLGVGVGAARFHLSDLSSPRAYDAAGYEQNREIALHYEPVSLLRLLAAPERYDGRMVEVAGFLTLESEGVGLHLDEDAYQAGLRKNAIWLDRPTWLTTRLDRRYAEVAGTFEASRLGQYGLYSGTLTNLRRVRPSFTQSDYKQTLARQRRAWVVQQLLSGGFITLAGWTGLAALWVLRRRQTRRRPG